MKFTFLHLFRAICFLSMLAFLPRLGYTQMATQASIGALYINGDVDPVVDALNSFHLGISRNLGNNFSAEVKFGFSKTVGLSGVFMESSQNGGGLVEEVYADLGDNVWYPNYLSTYAYININAKYILDVGIPRVRFLGGGGIGLSNSSLSINLLGLANTKYTTLLPNTTSLEDAKAIIDQTYDTTYETRFEDGGMTPHLSLQLGFQFKITRGIYFSADVGYHYTFSDYLDPIKNISATVESGNNDTVSIYTIGFIGYLLPDEAEDKKLVK